jgi:hypothetical protein
MASNVDDMSDGSDLEVEVGVEEIEEPGDEPDVIVDPVDRAQMMIDSDDEDEEFLGFNLDWTDDPAMFHPVNKRRYRGPRGPQVQHDEDATPIHYFQDFWSDEMWDHLVVETNR